MPALSPFFALQSALGGSAQVEQAGEVASLGSGGNCFLYRGHPSYVCQGRRARYPWAGSPRAVRKARQCAPGGERREEGRHTPINGSFIS